MSERIQKYLSNLGYGSRREVEDWIVEGRLVVNGAPAEVGQKIDENDAVKLDGKRLSLKGGNEPLKVLLYKKRTGEMVTRDDPEGRRTVFRKLPELETGRWIAVGRLDVNTSGLLLMTNHGELARRLMHPSFEQRREYAVRALGELPEGFMQRLQSGVQLEDGPAHFESIRFGDNEIEDDEGETEGGSGGRANHWFVVTITEGRHREVRRLFESQGLTVNRLIRTAYGPIKLGRGIKSGSYRDGTKDEIAKLLDAVGLDHSEALPERVRESHRERSEFPTGGKPKSAGSAAAPARGKSAPKAAPVENFGPKPKFRSGAEGWSKAGREERKQVERFERFEKDRPGVHRDPHEFPLPAAKPWAKKPAATAVGVGGEPEQFKARGFGAKSERSYAERGDSAPPPRVRQRVESSSPYKSRAAAGERPACAKKPYGDRPRPAGDGERPAFRPRAASAEGRPAFAKKPYGDRPARARAVSVRPTSRVPRVKTVRLARPTRKSPTATVRRAVKRANARPMPRSRTATVPPAAARASARSSSRASVARTALPHVRPLPRSPMATARSAARAETARPTSRVRRARTAPRDRPMPRSPTVIVRRGAKGSARPFVHAPRRARVRPSETVSASPTPVRGASQALSAVRTVQSPTPHVLRVKAAIAATRSPTPLGRPRHRDSVSWSRTVRPPASPSWVWVRVARSGTATRTRIASRTKSGRRVNHEGFAALRG